MQLRQWQQDGWTISDFHVDFDRVDESLLNACLAFQVSYGPAWIHVEEGQAILRGPFPEQASRNAALANVRRALQLTTTDASISIAVVPMREIDVYDALKAIHRFAEPIGIDLSRILPRPSLASGMLDQKEPSWGPGGHFP